MKLFKYKSLRIFLTALLIVVTAIVSSASVGVSVTTNGKYVSFSVSSVEVKAEPQADNTVVTMPWGYQYTLKSGDVVEVGDSRTTDFKAHVKTIRDNVWFSLGWAGGTFTPTLTDLTTSFNFNSNIQVSIYPVDPSARLPDGGIEYDLTLLARPAQNTITLDIDWSGITWQKILPLNVEYTEARCVDVFGAEGSPYVLTATSIVGSDGVTYKTRPEYEVNSYLGTALEATKDTKVMGWNDELQQPITFTNLSTTNLYIHRGQMTDNAGNKAWVEDINLDQTAKTITFTLPRTWIRNAVYPLHQVCGVDPAYTQQFLSWQSSMWGSSDSTWTTILWTSEYIDKVLEIILSNSTAGTENTMGVRANGSSLSRYVTLHEAEGGGQTHCRMFVQITDNGSGYGQNQFYHSEVSDDDYFYVVGYWSNVTFTELWGTKNGGTDGEWTDWTLGSGASSVHQIIAVNGLGSSGQDEVETMGIRANGSLLTRSLLMHEPEAGGSNTLDFLVKADASKIIEYYSSEISTTHTDFRDAGYFGTELDFVEAWQNIPITGVSSWVNIDLTAYLDQDGRMCDFLLTHSDEASIHTLGVRDSVSSDNRYLVEHEAESAGAGGEYSGFSMSAQSSAGYGTVKMYSSTTASENFYLTGYFKPASTISINPVGASEAIGVVDNSTTYYAFGSAPSNPVADGECSFTITNNGSSALDVDMKISDCTNGATWNIVSGSPGADEVRVTAYYSGQNPASGLVLANTDAEFYDGLAASAHVHWDFKFETGTLTAEATQHT